MADDAPETGPTGGDGRREVVVPDRLYRIVTVFSTLIAIVAVVGGFVLLDHATDRASATPEQIDVPTAILGLLLVAGGAVQYAFGTRFRARGMTTDKSGEGEPPDDG